MSNSAFLIRSCKVVDRFLQSAVIVDDRPRFSYERPPQEIVTPGRGQQVQAKAESDSSQNGSDRARHDLDAGKLINAFAELGVVCAVLEPDLRLAGSRSPGDADPIDVLSIRTDKATKRADIVILDWNILEEDRPGQNAKRLISEILRADESSPEALQADDHSRRLRLITIYTGDDNLKSITGEMADLLEDLQLGGVVRNAYCVTAGPVTIAVYGKGKPVIAGSDAKRRVEEDELPKCLRDDFSEMTAGLLSNAALEGLSAIRTSTHRILSRFNRGVDAPYVAHRAMMQPPEEAEEHPIPLIASEIEGVLADNVRIQGLVGLEAITEWFEHLALEEKVAQDLFEMDAASFKAALLSLLDRGLDRVGEQHNHPQWAELVEKLKNYDREAASVITQALAQGGAVGATLDMEFARLTSLRSQYDEPRPVLRLGSIVATQESGISLYFLCIQPLCDSVRLNKSQKFSFLKLKERTVEDGLPFDIVVTDQGAHKRFYVSRKAYDIRVVDMKPDRSSKSVRAERTNNSWLFQRNGSGSHLRWLADLKPDFAYRIVNQFVGDTARVGLTESEWLRRMAMSTKPARHGDR